MEVKLRIWIEDGQGNQIMGEGTSLLLEKIKEAGSLNKAASLLNMSYRAAWDKIKKVENRLGYPVIHRQTGGIMGGGSALTPEGEMLLQKYKSIHNALTIEANKLR